MQHRHIAKEFQNKIERDKLQLRLGTLEALFEEFIYEIRKQISKNAPAANDPHIEISLNRLILVNLVTSYFYDIERLKAFHGYPKINEEKKAGYLVKWIVKAKPIQFSYAGDGAALSESTASYLSILNETFALLVGAAYAELKLSILFKDDAAKNRSQMMIYHLLYRRADPNYIALYFNLLRDP